MDSLVLDLFRLVTGFSGSDSIRFLDSVLSYDKTWRLKGD